MRIQIDYKSAVESYHQPRAKYFQKRYYFGVGIFLALIILITGFIFMRHKHTEQKAQTNVAAAIPVPTGLDPNFSTQVNECFIPVAAIYGYTLRITSGFRSLAEQAVIYNSGRTVDGHIVTWAEPGKSLHNYGFAVDVVDRWRGYNIDFDKLAKIGTFCGLEQVDPPHFEHRAGLTTAQFAAGIRPPPLNLPCQIMDMRAKANQPLTLEDLQHNNCGLPQF